MNSYFDSISSLRSILRHRTVSRAEIENFQNQRLRRLVQHAYNNVPYYRRLFDRSKVHPNDIRAVADLSVIPVTAKKDLQALPPEEILARGVDHERLIEHKTSGSSGEPFVLWRTWIEERLLAMLWLRAVRDFGLRIRDKQAKIVIVRPVPPRNRQLASMLLQKLGAYRADRVDCLRPPEEILSALRDLRPDVLTGFPGVLTRMAEAAGSTDRRLVRPRLIFTGGEVLTQPMRDTISQSFGAPIFDFYGSHEFNLLAWPCKNGQEYHVCDDGMILEVVNKGRPVGAGERGEVVGTNLYSFAMPLIRFRLGDMVVKGGSMCSCGQPFSTLREIRGRMIDYFPLPSGRLLHPYEIVVPMQEKAKWIRQYQLVQEQVDSILLRIAPFRIPTTEELAVFESAMRALLEPSVAFRVSIVPELAVEANGKFRVSRSLVRSAYDEVTSQQV